MQKDNIIQIEHLTYTYGSEEEGYETALDDVSLDIERGSFVADRSTRLNSSHTDSSRMPSSA